MCARCWLLACGKICIGKDHTESCSAMVEFWILRVGLGTNFPADLSNIFQLHSSRGLEESHSCQDESGWEKQWGGGWGPGLCAAPWLRDFKRLKKLYPAWYKFIIQLVTKSMNIHRPYISSIFFEIIEMGSKTTLKYFVLESLGVMWLP